jgi:ABC-type transport system involved in cytochrome c biogenesis permease subunit
MQPKPLSIMPSSFAPNILNTLKAALLHLARPVWPFVLLPLIILLIAVATVAQKYMGLYLVERDIIYAWVVWLWGVVPLPGGLMLLALLTLALTVKFIAKSQWSLGKSGIILSHAGALLLLLGGLLTGATREDGYMVLREGDSSQVVRDYYQRSLLVVKDGQIVQELTRDQLKPGLKINLPAGGPMLDVLTTCHNCAIEPLDEAVGDERGAADKIKISAKDLSTNEEANVSGLTFKITGAGAEADGRYLLFEGGPRTELPGGLMLAYDKAMRQIPFTVKLVDFQKISYPGTDTAKAFIADVVVEDKERGTSWPARIEMNQPLRYRGYTFYQSSFMQNEVGEEASILAVSRNQGWLVPYAATIIVSLGLLLHLLLRLKRKSSAALSVAFLLCAAVLATPSAARAEIRSLDHFASLPILHEGRIQSLDTWARVQALRLTGRESVGELAPINWLATSLFTPDKAATLPMFRVTSPLLRDSFKLQPRTGSLYSLAELAAGLTTTADQAEALVRKQQEASTVVLSADEQALVDLHSNVLMLNQVMQAMSLLLPLPMQVPPDVMFLLGDEAQANINFLTVQKVEPQLMEKVRGFLSEEAINNPEQMSKPQQDLAGFVFTLQKLREGGARNHLFKIMPPMWQSQNDDWLSPWAALLSGQAGPNVASYLASWQQMAMAWRSGDVQQWGQASAQAAGAAQTLVSAHQHSQLQAELWYNWLHPFKLAIALYGAALLALVLGGRWWPLAIALAVSGLMVQATGLGLRMYILNRPPVGTLYESVLFVSWVAAFVALLSKWRGRDGLLLGCGLVIAAGLLLLAPALQKDRESLTTLAAVLNTNFWLATHVICITIGYGACLVVSVLAQAMLWQPSRQTTQAMRALFLLTIASAFFTTLGTLLGGVWADQSWGRFWGWDPKENGALIIALWIIWLLHGKIGGQLSQKAYLAGLSALSVVVALAWFGVNLLSTGLHSYGFITGVASGLAVFCSLQLGLIALLWSRAVKAEKKGQNHVA